MIKLIVGNKGSGKTKVLLNMCKEACKVSKGNIVFVEKGNKMIYDVDRAARLVDIDEYQVKGYDAFYGFLAGICAGNYDLTEIFVDSTMKIGGKDIDEMVAFFAKVNKLSVNSNVEIVFTVSCGKEELPEGLEAEFIAH